MNIDLCFQLFRVSQQASPFERGPGLLDNAQIAGEFPIVGPSKHPRERSTTEGPFLGQGLLSAAYSYFSS